MDREDGSIAALKANLYRPLQHWYRKNRGSVWLFVAVYYALQAAHFLFILIFHQNTVAGQTNWTAGISVTQLNAITIGYGALSYLLEFIVVLTLIKAPAMMVSQPEVELAYSRLVYMRCFIVTRAYVTHLIAVVMLLLPQAMGWILQLITQGWAWPLGPLMLTTTLVIMAYWLLVAAASVALSFLRLSNAIENMAAVAAIVGSLVVWMAAFRLGMLMTTTVGITDQVLVTLFRIAIWAFIFGTLFYFLHKRLIPRLAARYLTS
jgi:hypothetical protein